MVILQNASRGIKNLKKIKIMNASVRCKSALIFSCLVNLLAEKNEIAQYRGQNVNIYFT